MSTLEKNVPLARPAVSEADMAAVERVLRSGRLSSGPENERFEVALAEESDRAHAVCVSSGTTALELLIAALDIGPGDRVLVSAFGFPAVVNGLLARGAIVVPVDVDADSWTLDIDDAERAAGDGAKALVSMDQLGLVCEQRPLEEFAARVGLSWINDAACGLGGCDSQGHRAGSGGVAATFSFHPRKLVTTGEGGAVVTNDVVLAERLRAMRNHGQERPGHFTYLGTNARLAEASAALGTSHMSRLGAMVAERRLLAEGYRQRLASVRESGRVSWQVEPPSATHTYQTFAVLLEENVSRDLVCQTLQHLGIEAGPATYAFSSTPGFMPRIEGRAAPVADALHHRALALPIYVGMRSRELDRVASALEKVLL